MSRLDISRYVQEVFKLNFIGFSWSKIPAELDVRLVNEDYRYFIEECSETVTILEQIGSLDDGVPLSGEQQRVWDKYAKPIDGMHDILEHTSLPEDFEGKQPVPPDDEKMKEAKERASRELDRRFGLRLNLYYGLKTIALANKIISVKKKNAPIVIMRNEERTFVEAMILSVMWSRPIKEKGG